MTKKNKSKITTATERFVYLGPSCGGIMHYTVFDGHIPEKLKEIKQKHPEVKRLIVTESQAQTIVKRLEDCKDPLKILYDRLSVVLKEEL